MSDARGRGKGRRLGSGVRGGLGEHVQGGGPGREEGPASSENRGRKRRWLGSQEDSGMQRRDGQGDDL